MIGIAAVLALPGGAAAGAVEADGKATFDAMCASCHTIGGGKKVGPDLEGLADRRELDWARQFILVPDEVIASGDPIATALVEEYGGAAMPNLGVTEDQVGPLLAYLGYAQEPPATTTTATEPEPAPEPAPVTGSATRGKSLFQGFERFDAGGPSCLSCHSVGGIGALGGGQLGPDLTNVYAKYGGTQGLRAALEGVAFPTMVPIFSRKPLTEQEAADLAAFLERARFQERSGGQARDLLLLSLAAVALLGALGVAIWRRRLGGVRRPLVNQSRGK